MTTSIQTSEHTGLLAADMKQLLRHWYWQKFVQNRNTVELMAGACDPRNQQALGIVALLDVDPQVIGQVMDKRRLPFVQSCHAYLRSLEFQRGGHSAVG